MAIVTPNQNTLFNNTKVIPGLSLSLLLKGSDGTLDFLDPSTGSPFYNGTSWVFVEPLTSSSSAVGDVTGNFGSLTIANDAVTFAKMQNISVGLLGRDTGSGDPTLLTVSATQSLLGLGDAAYRTVGLSNGNLVESINGKIDSSLIPALLRSEFVQVANTAARLALTSTEVQIGDEAYEQDTKRTYKLINSDPSLSNSWVLIADIELDASNITSGVFSVSRLGTGSDGAGLKALFDDGTFKNIPNSQPSISVITANTTLVAETVYYCNSTSQLALALPATSTVGQRIYVRGINTGGFRITQGTGQSIIFLDLVSLTGNTGWLETETTVVNSARGAITLECVVANTTWMAVSSMGTFNIKDV